MSMSYLKDTRELLSDLNFCHPDTIIYNCIMINVITQL